MKPSVEMTNTSVYTGLSTTSGFHSSIEIQVFAHHSSPCSLHAFITFPPALQLDLHELRLSDSYAFDVLSSPLTTDTPMKPSKEADAILLFNFTYTGSVLNTYQIPFHARYGLASREASSNRISIEQPVVFWACPCHQCTRKQ